MPVLDGAFWNVVVSRDQLYLGRSLVALECHLPNLSLLASREVSEWYEIVRRLNGATYADPDFAHHYGRERDCNRDPQVTSQADRWGFILPEYVLSPSLQDT